MTPPGLFVSGTGTGVGKTWVSRGIARALLQRNLRVAALKPIETGCDPHPLDALALARAAGRPELALAAGLYRAHPPLAPRGATLLGEAPPDLQQLEERIRQLSANADAVIIEGAGGVLVPVDERHTVADLAKRLSWPLLLVARDGLGVLSHTLTAWESTARRDLDVRAVVLTRPKGMDLSVDSNQQILAERLPCPVLVMPDTPDDDDRLAAATELVGLPALLLP